MPYSSFYEPTAAAALLLGMSSWVVRKRKREVCKEDEG